MDMKQSARTDNSQLDVSVHSSTSGPKKGKKSKKKKKPKAKKNDESALDQTQEDALPQQIDVKPLVSEENALPVMQPPTQTIDHQPE